MNKKKLFVIMFLLVILCIMTLGYAALQERIDIEGEASVDSVYRVVITSVSEKSKSGNARSTNVPAYTNDSNNMNATFNVGLTNSTDKIIYSIKVTNYGSVDVRLNNLEINNTNSNIKVVKSGITNGDTLLHGGSVTFTITITLSQSSGNEQTSTITITPKYTRLKGGVGEVVEEPAVENNVYAFHTTELEADASYSDLQTIMSDENRQLYQDGTELSQVHPYYLKYTINGDEITKRYVCFIADNTEHCMQGGNQSYYQTNVGILQGLQSWFTSNGGSCSINASGDYSSCNGAGFVGVDAFSSGDVDAGADGGGCVVNYDGSSYCGE